jgi:transposase
MALGRKNWTFAGSDAGGERAAAIHSLIETAKLNGLSGVDRQAYTARRYSLHAVSQSATRAVEPVPLSESDINV